MSEQPPTPGKPSDMRPADRAAGAGELSEERLAEAVAARILELLQPVLEALAAGAPSGGARRRIDTRTAVGGFSPVRLRAR
jgi:hypothetical protein